MRVVRFHTRVPVVAPERVTPELTAALKAPGKTTWVAIHANHPRELTATARAALARLAQAGIPLVSQTVLLKGINDDADTLAALMRALVEAQVKPYYLHHGDLAPGTGHFRTTVAEGRALMKVLRGHLSGLCQPTYVLDIPGGHGKAPVGPDSLSHENGQCFVEDFGGRRHALSAGDLMPGTFRARLAHRRRKDGCDEQEAPVQHRLRRRRRPSAHCLRDLAGVSGRSRRSPTASSRPTSTTSRSPR